jgi:hypothetical protein
MFQQVVQKGEFSSSVVITFQVMAVARVSTRDPDPVRAVAKRSQDELGGYPSGAGDPDDPEVRGVLESTYPGQIRGAITAPVTKKCRNLRLPVVHSQSPNRNLRCGRQLGFLVSHPFLRISDLVDHGHDLVRAESLQVYGARSTGGDTETAALAQGRIDLRPPGKGPFLNHGGG